MHLEVFFDKDQHVVDGQSQVHFLAAVTLLPSVSQHAVRDLRSPLSGRKDSIERLFASGRVFVTQPHLPVVDDRREDVVELVRDR